MYALAASAAGVGLLALSPPSEAKIIYTKTHQVIGANGIYGLDLNHDGTVDFLIQQRGAGGGSGTAAESLLVKEAFGNAVDGYRIFASALNKGAPIGQRQHFTSDTRGSFGEVMAAAGCSHSTECWSAGGWLNVNNRFLGLKFQIGGKTHYGWARLNVAVQNKRAITATLTGYAYETIADKEIRAGETANEADALTSQPESTSSAVSDSIATVADSMSHNTQAASLGRLALGVRSVSLRSKP
jgi:hypothetical protein